MRQRVLGECAPYLDTDKLRIDTDTHSDYASEIQAHFPKADHRQSLSIRGALVGQAATQKFRQSRYFNSETATQLPQPTV